MQHRDSSPDSGAFTRMMSASLLALALAGASGCATAVKPFPGERPTGAQSLIWPRPPAAQRIAYVQSVYGPADLGLRPSIWKTLGNLLTGSSAERQRFVRPLSVALDDLGNFCMADPGSRSVCFFDRQSGKFRRWTSIGRHDFVAPVSVAKKGNTIFVADPGFGGVVAFTVRGKKLFVLDKPLQRPAGLAIMGSRLLVADAKAHKILIFDTQGTYLSEFGQRGARDGELNFPTHVAAGGTNTIYVSDSMNHRVQVFDANGSFKRTVGKIGSGSGHFSRPKGVATDPGGHLYVVDAMFDNVQVFDERGRFLLHWGNSGSAPGEFWLPASIAIGSDNYIYVADQFNHRLQIFKYLEDK